MSCPGLEASTRSSPPVLLSEVVGFNSVDIRGSKLSRSSRSAMRLTSAHSQSAQRTGSRGAHIQKRDDVTPRRERHGPIDRDIASRESDVTGRSRQSEADTRHAPSTVTAPSHARHTRRHATCSVVRYRAHGLGHDNYSTSTLTSHSLRSPVRTPGPRDARCSYPRCKSNQQRPAPAQR